MATAPQIKLPKLDLGSAFEKLAGQFRGLNPNDPPSWPAVPRYGLCLLVTALVVIAGWFAFLNSYSDDLDVAQQKESQLREQYKVKLAQAVNVDALRKQREQVRQYVTQLEKQLPSKAEMDALLSDINEAGLGRSLQFESFKPGAVVVRDYYAELPIALRVTGRYHDMGAFAADIANLSRIVTLNNLSISPVKDGTLSLDATAKTFRYLDKDEIAAQKKNGIPEAKK